MNNDQGKWNICNDYDKKIYVIQDIGNDSNNNKGDDDRSSSISNNKSNYDIDDDGS